MQTLATAESCTGGLIADLITNVPGCSGCFRGSVVAYHNDIKMKLLGVSEDTLAKHGAVSAPVAREMAEGLRRVFAVDWAISVTGIAGPDGGTKTKPVGLVFIGIADANDIYVTRHKFEGDRIQIKRSTANEALQLLWNRMQ
jgi:nicotinamide-nucleotide amidase